MAPPLVSSQGPREDRVEALGGVLADAARAILNGASAAELAALGPQTVELEDDTHSRRFARLVLDLFDLAGTVPAGRRVLDAGCGHGLYLIAYAALGAEQAVGIDVAPAVVDTVAGYLPRLPADLADRAEVHLASVADTHFESESFDVVVSLEGVGVYRDLDAFLDEATRVMAPGATLIIVDVNNALNPRERRKARDLWDAYENGPPGRSLHGHRIVHPYRLRRAAILSKQLPELQSREAELIAERTSGMTESEFLAAGSRFLADGSLPQARWKTGKVPVSPEGMLIEAPVDPRRLANSLRGRGLRRGQSDTGVGRKDPPC